MGILSKLFNKQHFEKHVDAEELRKLLLQHPQQSFSEIEQDFHNPQVGVDNATLAGLLMASLGREANGYIRYDQYDNLIVVFKLLSELVKYKKEVHPDVISAIADFFEPLFFVWEKGDKVKSLIPANLLSFIPADHFKKWDADKEQPWR